MIRSTLFAAMTLIAAAFTTTPATAQDVIVVWGQSGGNTTGWLGNYGGYGEVTGADLQGPNFDPDCALNGTCPSIYDCFVSAQNDYSVQLSNLQQDQGSGLYGPFQFTGGRSAYTSNAVGGDILWIQDGAGSSTYLGYDVNSINCFALN